MSKEKKAAEIKEEIKEEIKDSAQLTDEQMAEVTGGVVPFEVAKRQAAVVTAGQFADTVKN